APFADLPMSVCVDLARRFGSRLWTELRVPVYYYGEAATRPDRRELERVRRGGFEDLLAHLGDPDRAPDEGPPTVHPSAGATAVGARIPLIAYNVNLKTTDLQVAKDIAKAIRASSGGLPNVKALGFELADRWKVFSVIRDEARSRGVDVDASEIVGTIPLAAAVGVIKDAVIEPAFRMDQILEKRVWAGE
ncbi:MAG: glutamate formiminotransferase, partial [Chloroflexi bacterium]